MSTGIFGGDVKYNQEFSLMSFKRGMGWGWVVRFGFGDQNILTDFKKFLLRGDLQWSNIEWR